jgi:hypothetical protein
MIDTMRWLNLPVYIIEVVENAYSKATFRIRHGKSGLTKEIQVECGVFQGCPLSPILFAMLMELLIRALNAVALDSSQEVEVPAELISTLKASVKHCEFADDVSLIDCSKTGIAELLLTVTLFSLATGIMLYVLKCFTTQLVNQSSGYRTAIDPKLRVVPSQP